MQPVSDRRSHVFVGESGRIQFRFALFRKEMKKVFVFILATLTFAACQESLEEKAAREAEMYTKKNCPSQMSENIRMDSLTFESATHTLHYYYTLTGIADSIGAFDTNEARNTMLAGLKNTTAMGAYKEAGYQFVYTYHSEKNPKTVLFETVFSRKDYDQK